MKPKGTTQDRHFTRAFTLLEMMVVMAIATVLTTLGLVGVAQTVREARFRADRARLYMDVKEMRDRAKHGMRAVLVRERPATTGIVDYYLIAGPCPGGPPAPPGNVTIDYPAINHAGDRWICNEATTTSGFPNIDFIPVQPGAPPPTDTIIINGDGALVDSWNEFPDEGCLEANPSGDPDHPAPCG